MGILPPEFLSPEFFTALDRFGRGGQALPWAACERLLMNFDLVEAARAEHGLLA